MGHGDAFDRETVYTDRSHAGRVLGQALSHHRLDDPVVLGLARGGVPVAAEVAAALHAPMRACVARKIGAPGQPELALGAVAAEGPATYDDRLLRAFGLDAEQLTARCERQRAEARRQEQAYQHAETVRLAERDVIVVDDGLATGATARAAVRRVHQHHPGRVVLAVPVGAPEAVEALSEEVELLVCPSTPAVFSAVGQWYHDFQPVTDSQLHRLLGHGVAH
ncbi:phosphoribosyltransferase [Actinopolyspora erythraea]|uniref:Phosphoribosyltransferase n=1 Tax=Actinopolyspora erythraea TaxID=414996 RepID=A0A099D5A4_9ACTN|nr:phosphoribosyltransferase family protein [Actinopolyspora erythraea]ASU78602.1 phosphoribosyltransferase [Actinopolyspora erythraea]KGI81363.1 phosphoribosyltransferase [Actinopolyspora erythraea]